MVFTKDVKQFLDSEFYGVTGKQHNTWSRAILQLLRHEQKLPEGCRAPANIRADVVSHCGGHSAFALCRPLEVVQVGDRYGRCGQGTGEDISNMNHVHSSRIKLITLIRFNHNVLQECCEGW